MYNLELGEKVVEIMKLINNNNSWKFIFFILKIYKINKNRISRQNT
jgi:hypothetical protein